jgi:uncharacterized protein YpmS
MNKKGDMNWWLITMIIALLFLGIFLMIASGILDKSFSPIGTIQDNTTQQADNLNIFGDLNPGKDDSGSSSRSSSGSG